MPVGIKVDDDFSVTSRSISGDVACNTLQVPKKCRAIRAKHGGMMKRNGEGQYLTTASAVVILDQKGARRTEITIKGETVKSKACKGQKAPVHEV